LGFGGVELFEQVAVAVEEAAVHCGGAGDAGDADLGAVAAGLVDRGDDALAAARGVGLAPGAYCPDGEPAVIAAGPGGLFTEDGGPSKIPEQAVR
jgi:hypothetical protein